MHDRDEDISEMLTLTDVFVELGRFFLVSIAVLGSGVIAGIICRAI